jgi:hypothetical protein
MSGSYAKYLQHKNSSAIKKYTDYEAYITRKNYEHFCCCLQGETGPTGPQGDGLFGGTSVKYSNPSTEGWNNVITPPLGPSEGIRGNNTTAANITEIYACRNDGDLTDVSLLLKILETIQNPDKGFIKIMKIDDSSQFILYKVQNVIDNGNYITYEGVTIMSTQVLPDPLFLDGQAVVLTITANGGNIGNLNVLTNDNAEYYPLVVKNKDTIVGSTGATGWTEAGFTVNPFDSGISFASQNSNPDNFRTRLVPGAFGTNAIFNMYVDTDSGTGPSGGNFLIGKQNNIPINIDHYGETQISTAVNFFVEPKAAFLQVSETAGIDLFTKKDPSDTNITHSKIDLTANYSQIQLTATGKGSTGTQGPIGIQSTTVSSFVGPDSQCTINRVDGIRIFTSGNTGLFLNSGEIELRNKTLYNGSLRQMGLNWMRNNGDITIQSGPGFTGVDACLLKLDCIAPNGGVTIENSGATGLNIINRNSKLSLIGSNTADDIDIITEGPGKNINLLAENIVYAGSTSGNTGLMHVMNGITGTIKFDGGNNNIYVKNGWNDQFDSIPNGFTGTPAPHPLINFDGLYSALSTGAPANGQPYGYLPAGKIEFGGYTYSNFTAINPETGATGPVAKWQRTNRMVVDLTAGSELNNQVFDNTTIPPILSPGVRNAGDLVTIKGSVNILPNGIYMPWNSSLYMGKWGFGEKAPLNILQSKSSSEQPSNPGTQTLYPGSGNIYCNAVKQNVVHVEPSPFTNLSNISPGFQGQSTQGMYYNGGDLAYCVVDSTNGQNSVCNIQLPTLNNNMLGMTVTVTRMFVDNGSTTGNGRNAVLIRGSQANGGIDKINAPNSICVENNGIVYVSIDPYDAIAATSYTKPTPLYNSVNIGSVTFLASQKGWYNDNVTGGTGDDYSGDVTNQMYVWVVISTGGPGK